MALPYHMEYENGTTGRITKPRVLSIINDVD